MAKPKQPETSAVQGDYTDAEVDRIVAALRAHAENPLPHHPALSEPARLATDAVVADRVGLHDRAFVAECVTVLSDPFANDPRAAIAWEKVGKYGRQAWPRAAMLLHIAAVATGDVGKDLTLADRAAFLSLLAQAWGMEQRYTPPETAVTSQC